MSDTLIGYSGFVGSTLLRQHSFESTFRSTTMDQIDGHTCDIAVCAAAPAQKWIANRNPDADRENIERLIVNLKKLRCKTFVLISTVDVFKSPMGVTEESSVDETDLHPYGLNRRLLEKAVEAHFPEHLIVRLPGLVGPGLRKNIIFDFQHSNNMELIDSRGVFQFYPMVNLWFDVVAALNAGLKLLHLTAEPISVGEVSAAGFGRHFSQTMSNTPATYDFRTVHARMFGGDGHYQYSKKETLQAIRSYAQSEPTEAGEP